MKPIRILSRALELLGEVDNYLSFSFCRKYHTDSDFQLVTNMMVKNTEKLIVGNLVMLGNDKNKVGIIRHKEIQISEAGEEMITVKGYSLSHFLTQRITIPPEGQAQDNIQGDVETVMKHLVRRNCLEIPGMAFPDFIIAPNQNRGETLTWASRYRNLAEELEKISRLTGIGFQIYPDFKLKHYIFDVCEGRDVSANQSSHPPVIFSSDFDNLASQDYTDSLLDYGNVAIVAGQGEGVEREIMIIGSDETGFDQSVIFVDARDLENSSDLPARGWAKLKEHERMISFGAEVLATGTFNYEQDWDVGDIVTIQNKSWGVMTHTRISEVTEIIEGGGFRLSVIFGQAPLTLGEKLKRNGGMP